MFGFSVGEGTTDALLEGRVEPDEAPPGLQEVATLVLAARSLHANGGLAGENSVVCAFVETVRAPLATVAPISAGTSLGARRSAGRVSAKVAGAAAVLALGGATAAAATGSLPGSVQGALSRNLSHIGIHVPDPQTGTSAPGAASNAGEGHAGEGSSTALTAPSTTASEYGLCTAYFAPDGRSSTNTSRGSALSSVGFSRLTAAATAKGETVQAFCASIPKPGASTSTSTGSGSDSTNTASGGISSTDNGGKPATNPAGKTPGPPATTPAGNTPGGPPSTNPAGNTPGSSDTNPAGNTPGPPATNPAGKTPGPPATNPAGKTPGSNGNGQSGSHTAN